MSIYSGLQNKSLTAGLSIGGVVDKFWEDLRNLFTRHDYVSEEELRNLAGRIDRDMVGALDRYEDNAVCVISGNR